MGMDAKAYILWGFDLGGPENAKAEDWVPTIFGPPEPDEDYEGEDWEETYTSRMGLERPAEEWREEDKELWSEYFKKKRELIAASGVNIQWHGCDGCDCYAVGIAASQINGWWCESTEVDLKVPEGDWEDKLREFCRVMEIPWKEPKYILLVYYG
jgi:hypothetical protein